MLVLWEGALILPSQSPLTIGAPPPCAGIEPFLLSIMSAWQFRRLEASTVRHAIPANAFLAAVPNDFPDGATRLSPLR
jgi:hypothetical protein